MNNHSIRVNRFLASAGLGSRRACEEHVLEGRVSINGSVCRSLATRVTPEDDVRVNGRKIHQARHRYLLLHKPPGYVSTRSDRHAAKTIFDLLPPEAATLFHVGRLDKESEGLLLLTNDGLFAQSLLHPSRGIDKEYEVTLDQPFTEKAAAALKKGIWMEGTMARVESVKQLSPYRIKLVLHQGLKRQIRVMLGILGFKVKRLIRVRLGPIKLYGLTLGHYRDLKKEELEILRKAISPGVKRPPLKSTKNLFSQSTDAANYCVAPVLTSSSINYTLSRCALSTPCTSSASATLKTGSKILARRSPKVLK